MVKFWNGAKWIDCQLMDDGVLIRGAKYPVDADGFVSLGQFKFRLFDAGFKGIATWAYVRNGS